MDMRIDSLVTIIKDNYDRTNILLSILVWIIIFHALETPALSGWIILPAIFLLTLIIGSIVVLVEKETLISDVITTVIVVGVCCLFVTLLPMNKLIFGTYFNNPK